MQMHELVTAESALGKLGSAALPDVSKTLTVVKLLKAVRKHVEDYNDTKQTYLDTYGEDRGNGSFFIPAKVRPAFEKAMRSLDEEDIGELDIAVKLDKTDIAAVGLSANDILSLSAIVDFDVD